MNPYRALYRLGITPWERDSVPRQVVELADSAERSAAPGRVLDVGCGTGRDAVYLSERGWTVTGVDAVPRAIDGARRRAQAANAEVTWVLGDVTRLETLGIGDGYGLVVDRGCFHGLSDAERERCASGTTRDHSRADRGPLRGDLGARVERAGSRGAAATLDRRRETGLVSAAASGVN